MGRGVQEEGEGRVGARGGVDGNHRRKQLLPCGNKRKHKKQGNVAFQKQEKEESRDVRVQNIFGKRKKM